MFNMWVLTIYLISGSTGGPTTGYFSSQQSCEQAAATLKARAPKSYVFHACLPM